MSDDEGDYSIREFGNSLHFLGPVTPDSVHDLCLKLLSFATRFETVDLHLTSEGGCLFSSFKAYDVITRIGNVDTHAAGIVGSGAAVIYLAGRKRYVSPHSFVLIHQLSTESSGGVTSYQEARAGVKNDEKLMKTMADIVRCRANIPEKKLNEMLRQDRFVSAKKCVKYGISHALK